MRPATLPFALDPASDLPVFLQLARAVATDVRRGRLKPGQPLPGSRTVATELGIHRNTVLAAWRELEAEGWIVTRPTAGTFISPALPDPKPRRFAPRSEPRRGLPARPGFDVPEAHPDRLLDPGPQLPRGTIALLGGLPDVRLLPTAALARAYRRALRTDGPRVLTYGDSRGHAKLRSALATMLAETRAVPADESTILVTRGSQMALDLVSRVLLRPGDIVAVEALGYRPAWSALRAAGAELAPISVDAEGLCVDHLAALCRSRRVRAVYLTPHHQYPTTVALSPARRLALLALARAERLAILEDDYDNEFHYEGRPLLPLASADDAGVVVYLGTLSKILAPGLRLGFVAAPASLIERLTSERLLVDRQGDQAVERAVAELLEDGEVQRHARRMRRIYATRRDVLATALEKRLGDALRFAIPSGGMALWATVTSSVDVDRWLEQSQKAGVAFQTAQRFTFSGTPTNHVRLGFASSTEEELKEAAKRLAATIGEAQRGAHRSRSRSAS